jgi:hypothetical protein
MRAAATPPSQEEGDNMRGAFGFALALAVVLTLSAGISVAGASTKFSYTQEITDTGNLVFSFEEGSLKRFASVEYRLEATAIVASPDIAQLFEFDESVTLTPDDRGRVLDTLTLNVNLSPGGGGCTCGGRRVEYFDMTLTNVASGHVYRIDPISRDFPS